MSENRVLSRKTVSVTVLTLVIVFLVLLVLAYQIGSETTRLPPTPSPNKTLIQDGVAVPIETNLAKFLSDGNYHSIFLVKFDGRIKLAGATGKEIKSCGRFVDGDLIGCGLKNITIEKMTQITLFDIHGSPPCKIGNVDGDAVVVHKTNDSAGRWKIGQWDCHVASQGQHH